MVEMFIVLVAYLFFAAVVGALLIIGVVWVSYLLSPGFRVLVDREVGNG